MLYCKISQKREYLYLKNKLNTNLNSRQFPTIVNDNLLSWFSILASTVLKIPI